MAAVSTLILRSMRAIGEKPRGATLTSDEQTETLDEFNSFIEAIALEKLMCYTVKEDTHLLTVSTATYSIGPGATINTDRPTQLVDPCWVRDSNSYDYPVKIISLATYGRLTDKSTGATIPTHVYYDAGYSATSTASLTVYPPPSAGLTLYIHSLQQMTAVTSQGQTLMFPPGYYEFLWSNFAVQLAAGFTPVSAEVAKIARESKARIKALNTPDMIARLDDGVMVGMAVDHGIYIDSDYIE